MTDGSENRHSAINFQPAGHLLDARAVARQLNVPESWVRKHGATLPGFVRLGRYTRWNPQALQAALMKGN